VIVNADGSRPRLFTRSNDSFDPDWSRAGELAFAGDEGIVIGPAHRTRRIAHTLNGDG
jgi:hypothetical protein